MVVGRLCTYLNFICIINAFVLVDFAFVDDFVRGCDYGGCVHLCESEGVGGFGEAGARIYLFQPAPLW